MNTLGKGLSALLAFAFLVFAYDFYKKDQANQLCNAIQIKESASAVIEMAEGQGFSYNKYLYDSKAEYAFLLLSNGFWYRCSVELKNGRVTDKSVVRKD